MTERLRFDDWDRIVDELEQFGAPTVTAGDGTVRLEFEAAHLAVSRDGRFDAGMPLHAVDGAGAEAVLVDHGADTVTFEGASVEYTFRRPGSRRG